VFLPFNNPAHIGVALARASAGREKLDNGDARPLSFSQDRKVTSDSS
jgi:hypothetical protein